MNETHLPSIEATLNYLAPMSERPRNYTFDPPPGTPRSNTEHEAHRVAIHDVRPVASRVSLDREGFAVLHQQSAVHDFWDEDEIRRIYYPEAERVIDDWNGWLEAIEQGLPEPARPAEAPVRVLPGRWVSRVRSTHPTAIASITYLNLAERTTLAR